MIKNSDIMNSIEAVCNAKPKSIIEKLGIRQIPRYTVIGVFEDDDKYEMCLEKNVKELEHQRNELLETIADYFSDTIPDMEKMQKCLLSVEKVADKDWSEIKELI